MYKNKKILALVPARGGSKNLPRKNIKALFGKPLIAWTIGQAKASRYIDKIIVSTDDRGIAAISKKYGASIPFLRPKRLSTDRAKSIDVVLQALDWLKRHGEDYDLVLLLQPTSPLRTAGDIDQAIRLLFLKRAKSIISVCVVEHHHYWMARLSKDNAFKNFIKPQALNKRRQGLPPFYRLNGAIYLAFQDYIRRQRSFWGRNTFAYIMPKERSVDIDDCFDFKIAETLLKTQLIKLRWQRV